MNLTALPLAVAQLDDFYKEIAGISFTLVGMWWLVVQLKYREGSGDPARRRHAYGILVFFLYPGMMALMSAVNSEISLLWRLSFGVIGVLGVTEIVLYARSGEYRTRASMAVRAVALVIYVLIVLFAIRPTLALDLGLGLEPREVEAILVGLLLGVGVHIAFLALTESADTAGA